MKTTTAGKPASYTLSHLLTAGRLEWDLLGDQNEHIPDFGKKKKKKKKKIWTNSKNDYFDLKLKNKGEKIGARGHSMLLALEILTKSLKNDHNS